MPAANPKTKGKVKPEEDRGVAKNERALKGGFRQDAIATTKAAGKPDAPKDGQEGRPNQESTPEVELPVTDRLPFNIFVLTTTFLNILIIGLEQDLSTDGSGVIWFALESLFVILFIIELGIRWASLKRRSTFFHDGWNICDVILVLASAIDCFVLSLIGVGGQIRFFTVLRALRVIRFVRLVRMFSAFRELWLLVGGLTNSVKALSWVGLVVFMLIYVCGIICTAEIGQNDETYAIGPSYNGEVWPYKQYFGTVFRSMFTLLQVLTLDGWCDDIVRHVVYRQPVMGVFFICFILLTSFGLMNVVVGIIVENTLAAAQVVDKRKEEKLARHRKETVQQLVAILSRSDSRRSGLISLEELRAANQSVIVQKKFESIGLQFEEVEHVFTLLDVDRSGKIELLRFENACRELVGGGKRRDIAQVEVNIGTLANRLDKLDNKFGLIEREVATIAAMTEEFVHNTVRHLTGHDPTLAKRSDSKSTSTASSEL
ncbi:unnamed protein product [Effrenium voratum]|nr:unnamed protein product [Effrenium voratum]CAJ1422852.1 unnamed protein product [Effrenium voratum]